MATDVVVTPNKYTAFPYVRDEPGRAAADVMTSRFSETELEAMFIVHGVEAYRLYASPADFYDDLGQMTPTDRVFHETSLGGPQRLKIDVDCDDPVVDEATYVGYLDEIITGVVDAVYVLWHIIIEPSRDLCICVTETAQAAQATPTTQKPKQSNHLILKPFQVSGWRQAHAFAQQLLQYVSPAAAQFIDMQVYKRTQDFRLPGCHKAGQANRVKRVVNGDWADALVTQVKGLVSLRDLVKTEEPVAFRGRTEEHVDAVLELVDAAGLLGAHRYRKAYKDADNGAFCYLFTRRMPSACNLCGYDHPTENTLVVTAVGQPSGLAVYEDCRRQIDARKNGTLMKDGRQPGPPICLGVLADIVVASAGSTKGLRSAEGAISRAAKKAACVSGSQAPLADRPQVGGPPSPPDAAPVEWAGLPHVTYDEPNLRDFPLHKTLFVKANMKMGKTKKLAAFLAAHFTDTPQKTFVVRFVSFRQTFSGNIKEKFPEFTLYSDEAGWLGQSRLIIQVESLHRLSVMAGNDPPDLLILDECESIFEQFDSGLIRLFNSCFDKFKYLVRHSRHVVCMDAHLGRRTLNVMGRLRSMEDAMVHHCRYQNATEDTWWFTADRTKWLTLLYDALDADEKVAIPSSSLAEAKMIAECIGRRYPHTKVCLYSRETLTSVKVEHFARVDHYWAQYDVLLYTPTITAGISFELAHFDKIFGFFTNKSCPAETCVQMVGRIRDVAAKAYYVCLAVSPGTQPTTPEAIVDRLYDSRRCLVAEDADSAGVTCEYNAAGGVTLHFTEYYHMWLENRLVRNLSIMRFVPRLMAMVAATGARVVHLSDDAFAEMSPATPVDLQKNAEGAQAARSAVKGREVEALFAAPDLSEAQVSDISAKFVSQEDVSPVEAASYERHKLRKVYDVKGDISRDFIDKYNKPQLRAAHKNRGVLRTAPTWRESLARVKESELADYTTSMADPDLHFLDLKRRYVFEKHNVVCGLLTALGFDGPFDITLIAESLIERALCQPDYINLLRQSFVVLEASAVFPKMAKLTTTALVRATNVSLEFYSVKLRRLRQQRSYELAHFGWEGQ